MKGFVSLSFLTAALVSSMAVAHAGLVVNINIDEFGNGSFTTGLGGSGTLTSGLIADPTGGVPGNVLAYILPFAFTPVAGDLILDEPPPGTTVILSDVLRFVTVGNAHLLLFYSDNGDGVDALADISGLPGNSSTNVVSIPEIGPEGNNGATYTPVGVQPGAGNSDFSPTYNIISDSNAPEPASVFLMIAGLAGLGVRKYFRS
jgi:hypothetical protein